MVGDGSVYYKSTGKWWDYYQHEDTVIWDDFRGCDYNLSEFLKLLDRYPYKIEYKGGMCEFNSKSIILTSNKDWRDLYEQGIYIYFCQKFENWPLAKKIPFLKF